MQDFASLGYVNNTRGLKNDYRQASLLFVNYTPIFFYVAMGINFFKNSGTV